MHTSDSVTLRGSKLMLRWAVFHLHCMLPTTSESRSRVDGVTRLGSSLLLLRRLVDMCPFPQGKGVLTDIAKDAVSMVTPFKSRPVVESRDENQIRGKFLPPPPIRPRSDEHRPSSNITEGLEGVMDARV
eukprot:CAMPEP_0114477598 /NCGR_PEP_ID=MMETSP0104-20121206/15455_1 /TAXON_ID=37642 ORGANISM="Paraphysomonas imperforata, Strain PA2" /NCGR_SAMPLE_ID=MMETSP0104 /ASSEMBLY_ACC=CAM_ASM_000202 /LENGTH=129 /DNA_ID=CAMNT_0001652569 /DNA_START=1 /DNA_END=387 /DNA_ORIENTATION=+